MLEEVVGPLAARVSLAPGAGAAPSKLSITFALIRNTGEGLRQAPMFDPRVTDRQPSGQQNAKQMQAPCNRASARATSRCNLPASVLTPSTERRKAEIDT